MTESVVGLPNGPQSDFEVLGGPNSEVTTPVSLSHINPLVIPQGPGSMTDITLEQALTRVRELSKENTELQSYLRENNEMMKKQFETLSNWKQKVHDANQTNREKFDQTKALILSLRKEKEELLKTISDMEEKMKNREHELLTRIRTLETAKATSQQVAISLKRQAEEQGMSMTEPDINIQETVIVEMNAEKEEMIQNLQHRVKMLENNLSDLNETLQRRELEVKQFRSSVDQLLKDLEATQAIKDGIQKENAQLNEENLRLQQRFGTLLSETTSSLKLVDRGQKTGQNEAEAAERLGAKAESEPLEVTQLIDQMQIEQRHHQQEMAAIKSQLQEQIEKEKQVAEMLSHCRQENANLQQTFEMEIAKLNKEHDQKMMEFIRQHDTEKQQQLQSVASSHDNDVQSLRSQVLTLISEVHETQVKLEAATSALEKKDQRVKEAEMKNQHLLEEMNDQSRESQNVIQHLKCYKKNWDQERIEHQKTKERSQELQKSFNQLVDDYKELLDTFEQYKRDESKRNANSERLNELSAQVIAAEETIRATQEQINNLNAEKRRLIDEFQEMECVYKAQAEVYKIDFDAERQARERQVSEKEQILQEMQELQVNNQRLMDELELLSRRQVVDMQRGCQGNDQYVMIQSPGPHRQQNYPGPASPGNPPPAFRPPDQGAVGGVTGQQPPYPFQNPVQPQIPPMSPGHYQNPMAYQNGDEPTQHEEEEHFRCPQCGMQLPDMDTLQIHVVECVDNYEARP